MANSIDGLHLIVDGTVEDPSVFSEVNLGNMMRQLADNLEMTILRQPVFEQVELDASKLTGDQFVDEGGITGFCVISTSHISIHCWPLRHTFMMDIFSCKPFPATLARTTIQERLRPNVLDIKTISRRPPTEATSPAYTSD